MYEKNGEKYFVVDGHMHFRDGYVDKAIFLPTYLKYMFHNGFNTTQQDAVLKEKYPDNFILNTAWDPRDEEKGLDEFEEKVEKYGIKGVKLYTAEWREDSKGWSLAHEGWPYKY